MSSPKSGKILFERLALVRLSQIADSLLQIDIHNAARKVAYGFQDISLKSDHIGV